MDKKIYILIALIVGIIAVLITGVYFLSQEDGEICPVCGMKNCTMDHSKELNERLEKNPDDASISDLIKKYEDYRKHTSII